jgi:uncharacterized protein (TIGR02466 family)
MDQLQETYLFPSIVYSVEKPDLLWQVENVVSKYLREKSTKLDRFVTMSADFSAEPDIAEFAQYVSQTAWNILDSQGYDMTRLVTYFQEMWAQQHWRYSGMDQHAHGSGSQITAIYFTSVPADSSAMVIYDPRPAKVITALPMKDGDGIARQQLTFRPKVGMLILTPSWLPHSFTRSMSEEPMVFVHMNLSVGPAPEAPQPDVEIV